MKQKKPSIFCCYVSYFNYFILFYFIYLFKISTINKKYILRGFFFVILIVLLCIYEKQYLSILLNKIVPLNSQIYFIEKKNQSIKTNINQMCTTKWYKQLNLEFNVFSVNNFEKVMFMMDHAFTHIIKERFYKCVFFEYGEI